MTPNIEKIINNQEVILNELFPKTEYEGSFITAENCVEGLYGKVKTDEETEITICNKNLANPNTITVNHIVGSDGTFQNYTGESLTDYIKVKNNTYYCFSLKNSTSTSLYIRIGLYNANKEFINRVISTKYQAIFVTTEDTEYIAFSYPSSDIAMLEEGNAVTDFLDHQEQKYSGTNIDFKCYDGITHIYNTNDINMTATVRTKSE